MARIRAISSTAALHCLVVTFACSTCLPEKYEPFFAASYSDQARLFHTYSLNDQLELCIIGRKCIEPPDLLDAEMASNGETAIPLLLDRLRTAEDDLTREVIFSVFEDMAMFYVDLRHHEDVQAALKAALVRMRFESSRTRCTQMLRRIEINDGQPPAEGLPEPGQVEVRPGGLATGRRTSGCTGAGAAEASSLIRAVAPAR